MVFHSTCSFPVPCRSGCNFVRLTRPLVGPTLFCAVYRGGDSLSLSYINNRFPFEFRQAHLYAMLAPLLLAFTGLAAAHPASVLNKRQSYVGIATFNDYSSQSNTNCGPKSGMCSVASLLVPHVESARLPMS